MMKSKKTKKQVQTNKARKGAALMLCLFVIMFTSVMLINVYETETMQLSAHRNSIDYERAIYLAGAAVHHTVSELESNYSWRGTVQDGSYPANNTYQGTAVDGSGEEVTVTGIGVSGVVTRTLQVTITQGN